MELIQFNQRGQVLHDYSRDGNSHMIYDSDSITIYQLGDGGYLTMERRTVRYFPNAEHSFIRQFLERGA